MNVQPQITGLQQLKKSFLLSSKVQSAAITANLDQVKKSPSKPVVVSSATKTTSCTSSPKSRTSNSVKQSQNSSLNQHKPRLFAPYTLYLNTNPNTNNKTNDINNNTNNTKPISKLSAPSSNRTNVDLCQNQASKIPSNINPTSNNNINPQFKLYSQLNGFKPNIKPQKSNSIDENSLEKIKELTKIAPTQTPNDQTEQPQNLAPIDLLNENYSSGELKTGIKREDSAYCSSTSSTVSSQDVEIGGSRCCSIAQSKSNYELRSESTSSNCTSNHESSSDNKNNTQVFYLN